MYGFKCARNCPYVESNRQFSEPGATVIYGVTMVRIARAMEDIALATVGHCEMTLFGKDIICITQI